MGSLRNEEVLLRSGKLEKLRKMDDRYRVPTCSQRCSQSASQSSAPLVLAQLGSHLGTAIGDICKRVCILIDHGVQTVCTHYSGWYTVDRMYISPYIASTIHLYNLNKVGKFQFFDWKQYLGRNPSSINPRALSYYNHLILHFPFLIMVSDVHIYQIHTHTHIYSHKRQGHSLFL